MVYFTVVLLCIYILFAGLNRFGPKRSTKPFWMLFFRARTIMNKAFPRLFLCLLILSVVIFVLGIASNKAADGGTSSFASQSIITAVLCIGYYCLRDLGKSKERGEVCECIGNCSKCRIQCTTNEKYYGLNNGK